MRWKVGEEVEGEENTGKSWNIHRILHTPVMHTHIHSHLPENTKASHYVFICTVVFLFHTGITKQTYPYFAIPVEKIKMSLD